MTPRTCAYCGRDISDLKVNAKLCGRSACKQAMRRARRAAEIEPEARFLWFSAPGADAIERADLEFAFFKALAESNGVVYRGRSRRERVAT